MFNKLFKENVLYVQIWQKRIIITHQSRGTIFDEPALIAYRTNVKGHEVIACIGGQVNRLTSAQNIKLLRPFEHPRILIADFPVAEQLLKYAIDKSTKGRFATASPLIIIHPMEKLEGGITQVEQRAFEELALGAGARDCLVHQGTPLILSDFDFTLAKEKTLSKESSLANGLLSYGVIIVFALAVFSPIIYDLLFKRLLQ
ncbi:rod shape-determining protein [Psychromonas sp. psych-6C06]|uniref:rod shape-determining protein n=1 Tax=Psychromonas sp. psych-6C06 TaxID=2058089 RepID=UPI00187BE23D|nr:rod shape-determining protein [Psychromonas sp. psych-6C06]